MERQLELAINFDKFLSLEMKKVMIADSYGLELVAVQQAPDPTSARNKSF